MALFALEYFRIRYEPDFVAALLKPTVDGISMKDIRDVLRCHGLRAEGRQTITKDDLAQVGRNRVAFFRLRTPSGDFHYYMAVEDASGRPLVVDVLQAALPLEDAFEDKHLAEVGGMAVFVWPGEQNTTDDRRRIAVSPVEVELGSFRLADRVDPTISRGLTIKNLGDQPIGIKVGNTCGCLDNVDWRIGILEAYAEREINFAVSPQTWGIRTLRKFIILHFADGTASEVAVTGTGMASNENQAARLNSREVTIDVTGVTIEQARLEQEIGLHLAKLPKTRPVASVAVNWLDAQIEDVSEAECRLKLTLTGSVAVAEQLARNGNELVTSVTIDTQDGGEPLSLPVRLIRQVDARFVPDRLTAREVENGVSLKIMSRSLVTELSRVESFSDPPGIDVRFAHWDKGEVILNVHGTADPSHRFHLVRCLLFPSIGDPVQVSFLVVRDEENERLRK